MVTFEDSLVKVKEALDIAGKKTNEFIDTQKVKFNVAQLRSSIAKDYEYLGRLVHESLSTGSLSDDAVRAAAEEIDEKLEKIKEMEKRIAEDKGTPICSKCGAVNQDDACFCKKCGKKLDEDEQVKDITEEQ